MAFTAKTQPELRDELLAAWRARYLARDLDLDITKDSDAYALADALAIFLEDFQARSEYLAVQALPDQAAEEFLLRHATTVGISRKAATYAVLLVAVTGSPSTLYAVGGSVLTGSDGIIYEPVDSSGATLVDFTTGGGGTAGILVKSRTAGTDGNKGAGSILTWSAAPVGVGATATVASVSTTGADEESLDDLALRVIARRAEPPASGNRAHWRSWLEDFPQVEAGFIYPLYHHTLGANTLGSVTAIPVGEGAARVLGAQDVLDIEGYIEGTYELEGQELEQRRPAGISASDYDVRLPTASTVNVTAALVLGSGYSWPTNFTSTTVTTPASPACTTTRVYLSADPTVVGTSKINSGDYIAVGISGVRGGYEVRRVSVVSGVSSGGSDNYVEVSTAFSSAPPTIAGVRPAFAAWETARDNVLAIFDNLGPGDTSPACRWPAPTESGPSTLYVSALTAALMSTPGLPSAPAGSPGVASATVSAPASNQTPAALGILTPGTILFTP